MRGLADLLVLKRWPTKGGAPPSALPYATAARLAGAALLQAMRDADDTDPIIATGAREWLDRDGQEWALLLGWGDLLRAWKKDPCKLFGVPK